MRSISIWEHLTPFFDKRQRKRDNMTAMRKRKLHFNWWLARHFCLSSKMDYKMLLAWETLNIFILTGISKINLFFIKKKKNVVVYSNIHDKFASTNFTYNLKNKRNKTKGQSHDRQGLYFFLNLS